MFFEADVRLEVPRNSAPSRSARQPHYPTVLPRHLWVPPWRVLWRPCRRRVGLLLICTASFREECPSPVLHSPSCSCRLGGVPHAQRGSGRPRASDSDDGEPDEPGRPRRLPHFAPEAPGAPSKTPLCRTVYGALPTVKSGGGEEPSFWLPSPPPLLSPAAAAGFICGCESVRGVPSYLPTYLPLGRWLAGRPANWPISQPARARASEHACLLVWGGSRRVPLSCARES